MDKHEAEGFFPERRALRATRLAAMVDAPDDPSKARAQRVATWATATVTAFTPIFGTAVVFGWIPLKLSLEVMLCAASFILVVGGALAALNLGSALRRATPPLLK